MPSNGRYLRVDLMRQKRSTKRESGSPDRHCSTCRTLNSPMPQPHGCRPLSGCWTTASQASSCNNITRRDTNVTGVNFQATPTVPARPPHRALHSAPVRTSANTVSLLASIFVDWRSRMDLWKSLIHSAGNAVVPRRGHSKAKEWQPYDWHESK
jgi:hypothetical protein